ncbi:MAG: hypothetical protein LIO69_05080 [Oscillospiraceae bacterium]|nr:hypothetical protein [Oscillospiraceae bacterium]
MGSWGTGLWDSDTAMDIKEDYSICLRYSYDDEDALQRFMHRNEKISSDSDDGPIAVMILAKQMWQNGRLTKEVKQMAFKAVENDLKNWEYGDPASYKKRKKQLDKYLSSLNSEQPAPKNIKRMKPFENHWVKGDVLAVRYKGRCKLTECEGQASQIYTGGYILLIFDRMKGENPIFYTLFAPVNDVYAGMDISEFPYIQYCRRIGLNDEMVYRAELMIYGENQKKKMKFLGNYSYQPPANDDKEMTYLYPFDVFVPYAVSAYFYVNRRYIEAKQLPPL